MPGRRGGEGPGSGERSQGEEDHDAARLCRHRIARHTPRRPRSHDHHGRIARAPWVAPSFRRRCRGRLGIRRRCPSRLPHPVPALARISRERGPGLPLPRRRPHPPLPRHRRRSSSRVAPVLAARPQTARAQRGDPARPGRRHARPCRGGVDRRRSGARRHRYGHPNRARSRHTCAEPRRAPPTCRVRAAGGDPRRALPRQSSRLTRPLRLADWSMP